MLYNKGKNHWKPITFIIILLLLMIPASILGCSDNSPVDRGDVFSAVEQTLSKPGPVKDDLVERGLVIFQSPSGNTTNPVPGEIKIGEIEQLVKDGIYIIDEDGYLQFGPQHTPEQ